MNTRSFFSIPTKKEIDSINKDKLNKTALLILGFVFAFHLALRLYAISAIPPITDEPDDIFTISYDFSELGTFFNDAYAPDQSRLPFFISVPFLRLFSDKDSIVPLRILFLAFYFAYIWISYKLIFLVTRSTRTALLYALLLLFSCYLAGFSIFAISTAGSLYLLFHIMAIYFFWKSVCHESEHGAFKGVAWLSVLIGLCTASKLFGVLLLPAFMAFHGFKNKGKCIYLEGEKTVRLLAADSAFLICLVAVNIAPLSPALKLIIALVLSVMFWMWLAYLLKWAKKKDPDVHKTGLWRLWLVICLTAFCATVTFSPIYLNLSNIFHCVNWFGEWSAGSFVEKHGVFDIPMIMVIKYGLISSAILLAVLVTQLRTLRTSGERFGLLIGLVFLVQFIVISSVRFVVTWYPLAIFPFLYLPIVFFYDQAQKEGSARIKKISLIILFVIFLDNAGRYFYWYPYAHFDGGQYGKEHIGWNKSAMVSFEWFPQITSFFQSLEPSKEYTVNVQVIYVPNYNSWTVQLLRNELRSIEKNNISLIESPPDQNTNCNFVLSSPIGNPELEGKLESLGYKKIKMISLKKIDIISIWENQR